MRKFSWVLALACMCSLGVSAAFAGPGCCAAGKKDASLTKAKSGCSASASTCSSDAFPTMAVMVGEKSYDCPMEATKAAESAHTKPTFVVAGEKFDSHEKAMEAWACASEKYAKRFTMIACEMDGKWVYCGEAGCSKSCSEMTKAAAESCSKGAKGETIAAGEAAKKCTKFRVAGHTYTKHEDAAAAAKRAMEAVKAVKIAYKVEGKAVDCESKVCPMAKKDGKVEYVVGTESTRCEYMAKINLAKAQVEAARKAVEMIARV